MTWLLKKAIVVAVVLATGIVGYNYIHGTPEEKENSKAIIGKVTDLTSSVASLLQSEKSKYHEGKYDDAIGKMHATFSALRQKATALGEAGKETLDRINDLERQETQLEDELAELEQNKDGSTSQGDNYTAAPSSGGASQTNSDDGQYEQRAEQIRQRLLELNHEAELLNERL